MSSATFIDLRVNNAEQFKESVSEPTPNTKLYMTIGRSMPWANDLAPNVANSSVATVYEVWDTMIGGKRIYGNDLSHVIPRIDWTANTIYTAYDHLNGSLHDTEFYVITDEYNVYKCIANNYTANSTVKPTSLSTTDVSYLSDGYAWKYMYTVSDSDLLRFTTTGYIPVKTLSADDGSLQWQVQDNATEGSIEYIHVTSGGSGYNNADNISVTFSGDGSGLEGYATINSSSNLVNAVVITNSGTGYHYATVTIADSGSAFGANARAIISPQGGHGSNPLYELGGKSIIVNARIRYDEDGILPVTNDYRQISLLKDPLDASGNTLSTPAFLQTLLITTAGIGDFNQDETVYQGTSISSASFSGKVVYWDSGNSNVVLINTQGVPSSELTLIGQDSFTVRSISSITEGDLTEYSGRILYVDNFKPITRDPDQIENFKLIVHF